MSSSYIVSKILSFILLHITINLNHWIGSMISLKPTNERSIHTIFYHSPHFKICNCVKSLLFGSKTWCEGKGGNVLFKLGRHVPSCRQILKEMAHKIFKCFSLNTVNYPKKQVFHCNKLRHCAYILYILKTWFLKNDMLPT